MIHSLIQALYGTEARRFRKSLKHLELTQRSVLSEIAKAEWAQARVTYESFIQENPITEYEYWREKIEKQRDSGTPTLNQKVVRYEPTSGSQAKRKWIPYTPHFLTEINRAAQAWIHNLYSSYPLIKKGQHFWSLSWIPTELRGTLQTDDAQLFPWYQRIFIERFLAKHPAIQYAPTAQSAWWATKIYLASLNELSFLSIWSPSYLLSVIEELFQERGKMLEVFEKTDWCKFYDELKQFPVPKRAPETLKNAMSATTLAHFVNALWPKLNLVSCWDSASSKELADYLRELIHPVPMQSKGLWATEGVVTFPWNGKHALALRSHFYEFRDLKTGDVFASWELKLHQEVQPVITSGTGMKRYALPDRMRVDGFIEQTPTFEFLGRIGSVDLVGEKLSFADADEILAKLRTHFSNVHFFCLSAKVQKTRGKYAALAIHSGQKNLSDAISAHLETLLKEFHHYAVARELSQMETAECRVFSELSDLLAYVEKSQVKGQNKLNSIIRTE